MRRILITLFALVAIVITASAATEVTVGNFVYKGPYTFDNENCYNIERLSDAGKTVTGQLVVPGYVVVSGTRYRVRYINGLANSNGAQFSSVKIEYGVQYITRETFRDCTNLTSVYLPSSILQIGQMTFSGCSKLKYLFYAGEGTMDVQEYTFEYTPTTKYLYTATRKGMNVLKANSTWTSAFSTIQCDPRVAYDFSVDGVAYVIKKGIPYNYSSCSVAIVGGNPSNGTVTLNQNISSGLTNTPGSYPIREVSDSAFYNNLNVKTVANHLFFGYKIGRNAFRNCTNLTSVDIAADSIYPYAFYGCSALTSITLHAPNDGGGPGGVHYIDNYAFGCVGATSVTLPSCLEVSGAAPFYHCPNLTSISISSSNANFSCYQGCLYNKDYSRLYQIPEGLTSVSFHPNLQYVLSYCGSYNKCYLLSFPYGIKNVNSNAFSNMPNLKQVCIPSSLTSMNSTAFAGSTGITEVELNQVTPPSSDFFPALTKSDVKLYIPYDGFEDYRTNSIWKNYNIQYDNSDWNECYDFADVNYYTVTGSNEVCLVRPSNSTTVTIPNTVTCNGITYKVKAIGPFAFYDGPTSDFTVSCGSNLATVRDYAFFRNTHLKSFSFEYIKRIDESAFSGTTGLTGEVRLNNCATIGSYAFSESGFTKLVAAAALTDVYANAFRDCLNLTEVYFSNCKNLTAIPSYCFYGCTSLYHFYGQNTAYGTTNIGNYAFKNCRLEGYFYFPTGTKYIYDNAFEGTKIREAELPYGTVYVGNKAFLNCTKMTKFVAPATVTTIKPDFVKGCTSLFELVLNQKTPLSLWGAGGNDYPNYLNTPSSLCVYVPVGCVSAYANNTSSPWYTFYRENTNSDCILEGSYDFTDQFVGYKFDVVNYPSSANSYMGNAKLVYNPNTINKKEEVIANNVGDAAGQSYRITAVGDKAFYNSSQLKTFKYTSYLTEIGEYAFANTTLTNFYFDDVATSVSTGFVSPYIETIGQYAFYNSPNLTELMLGRTYEAYSSSALGKRFFGNNTNAFRIYVDYHHYDNYKSAFSSWPGDNGSIAASDRVLPYVKATSNYQSFACSDAIKFPSGITCYVPKKYIKSTNKVYLASTDVLDNETGAVIYSSDLNKYYRLSYPSTWQDQSSLMKAVLGTNQNVNSTSSMACFTVNGNAPSFTKITSSTLFKTGEAYLQLAISDVGSNNTVGYTFTDSGSGGLKGDVNGDGIVNGSDVTALYNVLLDGTTAVGDADVNGDGFVNGSDVTALYNILLGS